MALLLLCCLHKLKRWWVRRTATIQCAVRSGDELCNDAYRAGRKSAHVMPYSNEFNPSRLGANDRCDATTFVRFGNRVN